MKLKILAEFRDLLPALSTEELALLRESIAKEGCREPLVVWRGVIADGHNRYSICEEIGAEYATIELDLPNKEAVKDWIDRNQLARRNLTPEAFTLALGRRYNRVKVTQGGDRKSKGQIGTLIDAADAIAAEHGVSPRTVKRAGKIADAVESDPEIKAVFNSGEKDGIKRARKILGEKKKARRAAEVEAVREKIASEPITVDGTFDVVAIDPPWPYGRKYDPETSRVANPYPEMPLDDIAAIELPIEDDAVVFLWTTHAFLQPAFGLLEQWGLTYKATLVWDKEKIGMGATVRMQCEFCLLAVRGKPHLDGTAERDIIREARREHSRKPDAFYSLVERMTAGRRLDYFSREAREGWASYGAETDKF